MTNFLRIVDLVCLTCFSWILYSFVLSRVPNHPNSPPIVRTYVPWFGSIVSFMLRRTTLLNSYRAQYGPVYKFLLAGRYFVVVSTPRTITSVIDMSPKIFLPPDETTFKHMTGLSERLPYVTDLLHHTAYVYIASGLTKRSMGSITIPMNRRLYDHLQRITMTPREQKPLSLHHFVSSSLYNTAVASFFGTYMPDTFPDFINMDRGMFFILNDLRFFHTEAYKARARLAESLEPYVRKAWEECNEGFIEGQSSIIADSLSKLKAGDISVFEVSRLLVAVLWGFHSNLIYTGINALAYILADPVIYYRITSSVRKAISEKYVDFEVLLAVEPEAIDCEEFAILDSIILETLRITTVATSFREALCDTYIRGDDGVEYFVRKGEVVVADVRAMHHDDKLFPEPQKFVADRFINADPSVKVRGMRNFRPWGGGAFVCKGREFAHYALKMFLLQTFYLFDIVPGEYMPSFDLDQCVTVARLRDSPTINLRRRAVDLM